MVSNKRPSNTKRRTQVLIKIEKEVFLVMRERKKKSLLNEDLCSKCVFRSKKTKNCLKEGGCFTTDFDYPFYYKYYAIEQLKQSRF